MRPGGIAHYCVPYLGALCLLNPPLGRAAETSAAQAVHPERWPRLKPALPRDPDLESRIEALLARMTSAHKVGQLIQADIDSITPDDLAHCPLGSVLNGGNSSPHGDKLAPPGEWLALADRFYDVSLGAGGSSGIPLLWGTDAVHGHNNIPAATIFPHNIGLGATRDPALIRRIGEITALEVRVTGLDWAFSPSAAVARDARWGRTRDRHAEALSRRRWHGRGGPGRQHGYGERVAQPGRRRLLRGDRRRSPDRDGLLLELARGEGARQPRPPHRSTEGADGLRRCPARRLERTCAAARMRRGSLRARTECRTRRAHGAGRVACALWQHLGPGELRGGLRPT